MRVQFWPINIDGQGCYRAIFPSTYLREKGHTAGIPAFMVLDGNGRAVQPLPGQGLSAVPPGQWLIAYMADTIDREADAIVVQVGSHKWQHDWLDEFVPDMPVILETDDAQHEVPAYNPGRLAPTANKDVNRRLSQQMAERAELVITATPELARLYSTWNDNVVVVPNSLHWPMWDHPPVYEDRPWRKFRVGYMGNMDYHGADLKLLAEPLKKWLDQHPDAEFVAAGDPRMHDLVRTPRKQRVSTSNVWFRCMDLWSITATFDVGLVPLVKNRFNECKSCLKGMEYNACGIPVLASPTEDYARWVDDGENGFLCRHPRDFIDRLDDLYANRDMVRSMGAAGRAKAREQSLDRTIGDWEQALGTVCDRVDAVAAGTAAAA